MFQRMWLLVAVMLLAAAVGEERPSRRMGAWPRQSGPYGYHRSVASKYDDPSYLTPGGGKGTDTYDELLQELYRNHNFDVDNPSSEEEGEGDNNTPSTDYYTGSGDRQRKSNNGFYGQSNRGFNRGLDSRGFFNGMDQPGGSGASQGWGQDQGQQQDIRRKAGLWGDAEILLRNTMRSDTGYGVAAGNKLPIDVYSILALVLFTAFLSYLIYHYITTVKAEDARSLGLPQTDKVLWILEDVTRAFERWAAFEFLTQDLIQDEERKEEEEEEEEEEREKVPRLLDG